MEEYLQYMKTLRCQMNGTFPFPRLHYLIRTASAELSAVAAQKMWRITRRRSRSRSKCSSLAFKPSKMTSAQVSLLSTCNAFAVVFTGVCNCLKLEMQKLSDGSEHIAKAKGQTCFQLLEVQRKVSALESDSCMLIQIQSIEYCWESLFLGLQILAQNDNYVSTTGYSLLSVRLLVAYMFGLVDLSLMKEYIMQMKCRASDFKQELREMDIETLEKGPATISSDKVG
ncbi:hypothetical protein CRG98_002039 [Punica granatum]|uniref:Uncharacterized protein n=1 Tax=Punica granatum TaxID=22663 RepID=A0A2I0LA71_PUNGR|nr:hypothetical protein CRG98_002039 [Punica granatum]